MIATMALAKETNGAVDNSYAALFFAYISRSLDEALAGVRAVQNRLADEERIQACHVLDYGLRAVQNWPETCDLTIALATYMERGGHWEIWQQFLQRAIVAAQEKNDSAHEITLTALLARLYQRWNKPVEMVQSYRRAIRLARRNGNRYELARACSNLGYHYILTENLWCAELLSNYALVIFNDLASDHGRAHTHNHLGILFTRQYDWAKAKEHLLTAFAIWQASHDQFGLMRGYGNLNFLYNETTNYEKAIDHGRHAIELAEASGEEPLIGGFASNLSFSHLKLGNVTKAKEFAQLAETIFNKYTDRAGLARLAHTKALIEIYENNYMQARDYINQALSTLEENYLLIQVKLTKLELEVELQNYIVAKQELNEIETWITKHLAGNAWQFYTDRFTKYRLYLEQTLHNSHPV